MGDDSTVLRGGPVHTGRTVLADGWLAIVDGTVRAAGEGALPETWSHLPVHEVRGRRIVPGFVDIHCHGGAGAAFGYPGADPGADLVARDDPADRGEIIDAARRALALHRSRGTTTVVASLVTAPLDALRASIEALAELVDTGELAGIHLEGPWLNPLRRGAHDATWLHHPAARDVDALLAVRPGAVRVVTLAPELAGGLDAVRRIVGAGAVAAVGHTDADAATVTAAVDAGARLATHLFNAMPPVHHRDPGPVLALLADERVRVELVADGVHLHPLTLAHAARAAGRGRAVLVSDAVAATGTADGAYVLGGLAVDVAAGVARLRDTGAIAGSTSPLAAGLRHATAAAGLAFDDALAAITTTPAAVLGREDVGNLEPGAQGDAVVLDDDHTVHEVFARGIRVTENG